MQIFYNVDMTIDEVAESDIDWDWYAVDQAGNIGHFTSAGIRKLPESVKGDRQQTELVRQYFFERAAEIGGWSVREGVEADSHGWGLSGKDYYLRDFGLMARKGLFSFDTEMIWEKGRYYLVAIPEHPLQLAELPVDIAESISQTRAPLLFPNSPYIQGDATTAW